MCSSEPVSSLPFPTCRCTGLWWKFTLLFSLLSVTLTSEEMRERVVWSGLCWVSKELTCLSSAGWAPADETVDGYLASVSLPANARCYGSVCSWRALASVSEQKTIGSFVYNNSLIAEKVTLIICQVIYLLLIMFVLIWHVSVWIELCY